MKFEEKLNAAVLGWLRTRKDVHQPVDKVLVMKDESGTEYETFGSYYRHEIWIKYLSGGETHDLFYTYSFREFLDELLEVEVD